MPSYAYLRKKAGLPAPTGFAVIERSTVAPKRGREPAKPIVMTPDFITHTAITFMACCDHKQCPGPNLQSAILVLLNELRRLKS